MSIVGVTCSRTIGRTKNLSSTALAIAGFLAATSLLFALGLEKAEGGVLSLAAVWTAAVSPILPVLAAVMAMDVWSDERLSGRLDLLLSAPVREKDVALGKFLGVWTMCGVATLLSLAVCMTMLYRIAPKAFVDVGFFSFFPGLIALALQSFVWCSLSVVMSTFFRHAAAAACTSVVLLCGIPRGVWAALLAWSTNGRAAYGEMPFDAHAVDMALGVFPLGVVASYVVVAFTMLFIGTKCVELMRMVGRGAAKSRLTACVSISLSLVLAWLLVTLFQRFDAVVELPVGTPADRLSQRTLGILSESSGKISVTCFLPRSDERFRSVGHMLRSLRMEALSRGGADIGLRYVDSRWDLNEAQRLVRSGVSEASVVFERNRRRVVVPLSEAFGERVFASAILKLTVPQSRNTIYWTEGHGEVSPAEYSSLGMSDISRELSREGFRSLPLDLASVAETPADCALVVVAGAKEDFSRTETDRLDSYLKKGGRLMVLAGEDGDGGLGSLLSAWGFRLSSESPVGAKTFSGSDVVAPVNSDHAITAPLAGTQIVLDRPVTIEASAASSGAGADGVEFSELVRAGGRCLAAVTERGSGLSDDLALRPTRIVLIGDSLFVVNGQLASRGNANMDFFMNCVAYLAGTGAITSSGEDGGRLVIGMDRASSIEFAKWVVGIVPGSIFILLLAYSQLRRRRT